MFRERIGILLMAFLLVFLAGCIRTAPTSDHPQYRGRVGQVATPTPLLSPAEQLLVDAGPGWEIISQADYTGDTIPEVIIARTHPMTLAAEFLDPLYADYTLIASELQIVELDSHGEHTVLLQAQPHEIISGGVRLISLMLAPEAGQSLVPSAFLISDPDVAPGHLTLIPLNASGERFMQSIGLSWQGDTHRYRLFLSRDE